MSQSPVKRRKLSPEPRLDATPSIHRYPSFASPTRSSIARVAPQILERRAASMENDTPQRTRALARTPPGQENLFVTQSSQGASQEQNTPSRPIRRSPRSGVRGGMASAPRRPSRSPQKAPPTPRAPDIFDEPPPDLVAPIDLGLANPFQKRSALRRSPSGAPPVATQESAPFAPEAQIDPFKRGGLRRSGGGIAAAPVQNEPPRQEPVVQADPEIANPFEKRGLRRSDPRTITESMVAMPPPPPPTQPRAQSRQQVDKQRSEQRHPQPEVRQEQSPARQPKRSMAVRERSQPAAAPTPEPAPEQAPERAPAVAAGFVAEASQPPPLAAPTAAAVAASDGRAALRNQRLRGAQTRSPGQVDFGFNIPAAAPRPDPPTSAHVPAPTLAAPLGPVTATPVAPSPAAPPPASAIPTLPVPAAASTPTPAARSPPVVAESPLFVSQTTNSPLPNIDSSILSTHTPTPAPAPRISRAAEKQPAQPERSRTRVSEAAPEEPELPPTPTQRGIADPIVTTPPTGIHNTPSKRLKRRTVHQSSPLKPRAEAPPQRSGDAEAEATEFSPQHKRHKPSDPSSRFTQPIDPNLEKKKKRDRMLAEIRQLESDIRLAERENERVRKATASGKDPKRPANADALAEMLSRTMARPPSFEEPAKNPPSVLDKVNLFLPFARPPKPRDKSMEEIVKTENLPSVLPVEVDNPLLFLSVFTPFKFQSTITTLPPTPGAETGETDILQLHNIVTSAPHCLFSSKINVTVNTRSGSVERCDIEYLDPAAENEFGPWARKRAQGGVLGRDINSIYWASSQWYETALKRAKFWCQLEFELRTPEGQEKAKRRIRVEARRGRRLAPGTPVEPEEHFEEDEDRKFTPEQLRRNMGKQSMEIEIQRAKLILSWKIEFDWTGEAEQSITAAVKAPRSWHEMDERKQLDRIPEIFKGLVKERSQMVAARTCVVLLMGE